jgi:hypothetical protein
MVSQGVGNGLPSDQGRYTSTDIEVQSLGCYIHKCVSADNFDLYIPIGLARFGDKALLFSVTFRIQYIAAPSKLTAAFIFRIQ